MNILKIKSQIIGFILLGNKMALKDYGFWHKIKTFLHNEKPRIYFHLGEVWFCNLGANIGFEQDGDGKEYLRPVIILRKFNNEIFWAIPLTKTKKEGRYYYHFYFRDDSGSTAILSQIRLLDAKRLKYKTGTVSQSDFAEIKQKLKQLLE